MTKEEAVEQIVVYRRKVEKIEKKIRYIQTQQAYRDEVKFGYYLENIDFLILTIGLNLEALELSIDRTLALYQEGFLCQTEPYIEEDTRAELKKVRKKLREIDELLQKAVTEKTLTVEEIEAQITKDFTYTADDIEQLKANGWIVNEMV